MDSATLRGRRGIAWSRAAPALARGWRLVIGKPSLLGSAYGAMASIVADPGAEVWGVLYEISPADLEHLELTEGVLIDHYQRASIVVEPSPLWDRSDAGPVAALTLTSDACDPLLRPTLRYMGLLLAGAVEHGLPDQWLETLRGIEAVDESEEAGALRLVIEDAIRKRP